MISASKSVFIVLLSFVLYSSGCSKGVKAIPLNSEDAQTKLDQGFVLYEITKKHSEGECGFLLKEVNADQLSLFVPVSWPEELAKEGTQVLIKANPSRKMQSECLNAQPVVIEDFQLVK